MASEDQGSGTGSVDPTPNNKPSDDLSLAARRARLRGSLAKQAHSTEAYTTDKFQTESGQHHSLAETDTQASSSSVDNGGKTADASDASFPWEDPRPVARGERAAASEPELSQAGQTAPSTVPVPGTAGAPAGDPNDSASLLYQAWAQQQARGGPPTPPPPQPANDRWPSSAGLFVSPPSQPQPSEGKTPGQAIADAITQAVEERRTSADLWGVQPIPAATTEPSAAAEPTIQPAVDRPEPAATTSPDPVDPSQTSPPPSSTKASRAKAAAAAVASAAQSSESKSVESPAWEDPAPKAKSKQVASDPVSAPLSPIHPPDPKLQAQTVEVLNNIDQAMSACAMNLSALQKIATEQTDALKGLAETMQGQNFFEIGLNLNTMIESMSAALEPMKAVGELVPAIDQLVVTLESRQGDVVTKQPEPRKSPEQLVVSLADQLSAGLIDGWTFKSAYMAVYPEDRPAELLSKLVDLLGAQKMSGDGFRAAYDAVQSAQPQEGSGALGASSATVKIVQDPTLLSQIEELRQANEDLSVQLSRSKVGAHDDVKMEELQSIIEELQRKLEQRESEFADVIAAKDRELQETQELMASRWEEYNARYDELHESLQKRDEMLSEKDSELGRKESEVQQLKTQMEELRDQTKDMVSEMQKQLSAANKPKEEKQSGFFDAAPGAANKQLFDTGGNRPLFQPQPPAPVPAEASGGGQPTMQQQQPLQQQQQQSPQQQMQPQQQTQAQPHMQPPPPPQPPQQMAPPPTPSMQPGGMAGQQAIPRPSAPTSPFLTGGSYGSGVRAQVFEVIVRQALAGAPWRDICAGPMSVNNITAEEVEAEVKRRQALLGKK